MNENVFYGLNDLFVTVICYFYGLFVTLATSVSFLLLIMLVYLRFM